MQLFHRYYSVRFTLLIPCLLLTMFFCFLSSWQFHRYHFKQNLIATYQQRLTAAPIPFIQLPNSNLEFRRVEVTGLYLHNLTLFIQNQFYRGQVGYEVITPLKILGDKKLLLIDRGWVKNIPFDTLTMMQHIMGYVKLINESQFILGKNITNTSHFPLMMQKIDINELQQLTKQSFYPFIIRLDPKAANGFIRDWTINTVAPQQHLSYAIQWLVMAVILLVASLYFCCRRKNDEK